MNATALLNTSASAPLLGGAVTQPQIQAQALVGQQAVAAGASDFALTLAALPAQATAEPAIAAPALPLEPMVTTHAAPATVDAAQDSAEEAVAVDMVDVYALAALGLLPMQNPLPHPQAQALADKPLRAPLASQAASPASLASLPQTASGAKPDLALPPVAPPVAAAALGAEPASADIQQLIERLSAQPSELGGLPLNSDTGLGLKTGAPVVDAGAPVLALKGEPRQWQQPLMQALGDRLQVQIASRSEQAVIRLDPPMLGQVEISIRQQAGELQVRMSASHGEVARQLHQVSDTLRQDLVQRHSGDVTVQVTQSTRAADETRSAGRDPQSQQQQQGQDPREQQQQQRRPGRGLGEEGSDAFGLAPALNAVESPV
jgi:flagellar hook-length control protein FliK